MNTQRGTNGLSLRHENLPAPGEVVHPSPEGRHEKYEQDKKRAGEPSRIMRSSDAAIQGTHREYPMGERFVKREEKENTCEKESGFSYLFILELYCVV